MEFINKAFCVGLGGFLGSISRYLLDSRLKLIFHGSFPFPTLIINLLGAFFIGLTLGLLPLTEKSLNHIYLFLITGFLASFTTFSTLSLEALQILKQNLYLNLIGYIFLHIILGIFLTYLGFKFSNLIKNY